ncbi:GNAT family N-acetyltransferase [Micromonospora aurantiaca]|uniref:GNAT family N-acetyltransferase n=1 Tax=Micromonospora aurantiaca (nom. illeg.) TaxID=47850 RepID=UPI000F3DD0A3|nr:GNAT family N-acetyltransferase [Micromonospora aurantiaca]RNH98267.1 N-acetyltransferase [Micromonospora aurantiaca]
MTHHIRAARWRERDIVAAVIAEALQPTPIAAWLVPDEEQRGRVLTDVATIWVEHAMFYGDVHVTTDLNAAVVCFHRYGPVPPPANYSTRLATAAGPHTDNFLALDEVIASRQPAEAHYQLAYLAVRPTHQRAGLGRRLMEHLRSRLDLIDLPSWALILPAGEPLLAQAGYKADHAIVRPTGGVTVQPMSRRPGQRGETATTALRPAGRRQNSQV